MFPEITSQISPFKDYTDSSSLTVVSRRAQPLTEDIMEGKFFFLTRQQRPIYYTTTLGSLDYEYDLSSVYLQSWPNLFGGYIKTIVPFEMLEHNIIIKMSPRKRYNIKLEINEIRKAKPRIIDPDWL